MRGFRPRSIGPNKRRLYTTCYKKVVLPTCLMMTNRAILQTAYDRIHKLKQSKAKRNKATGVKCPM